MQEIEFLLREIGEGAMSSEELKEYIAYNYSAKGFKLFQETPFPVTKDGKIKSIQIFMVFVKDETISYAEAWSPASEGTDSTEAPKKRGRPAKLDAR